MTRAPIGRMREFGTTIFAEMTALATKTGAINLGQGFPDTDGPAEILAAAVAAVNGGQNQYAPGLGILELREAIAEHQAHWYGLEYDPSTEVVVTAGATEAIAATILALSEPGDEVLCFEPFYDSYAATIALAGAVRRPVTLRAPTGAETRYRFEPEELRAAVTSRTRLVLLNSPHNPTGMVFTRAELEQVAALCQEHDLIAVTDEVYEHQVFSDSLAGAHVPLATLPGMRDRTVTISSAGKTFSVTGWKVGWVCAPADLASAVNGVKQFLTYTNAAPLQPAVAHGLRMAPDYFTGLSADLRTRRDLLGSGLASAGLRVLPSEGTYFLTCDISGLGAVDGLEFCRMLPETYGVAAVPTQVFYDHPEAGRQLVRFAFCKRPEVLIEAVSRLRGIRKMS